MSEDVDVDLVVAGAGGGLAGALRAGQLGLSCAVVEASGHFKRGNNTSMSTAMIPGAGSRWQRALGVEDSPERFVADVMAKTHDQADPQLARALAEVSAELVEWLADFVGLPFDLVTDFNYPGHSALRCHSIEGRSGAHMLDGLVQAVRRADDVDLVNPATLVDVETDDHGAVRAAVVTTPEGGTERIRTRAVLLATNGFGANPDLVARHLPGIATAQYHGSEYSRGDALRIGTALGAATGYLDAYQGHGGMTSGGVHVSWAAIMHGGILVNARGERFSDESTGYSEHAEIVNAQPGGFAWLVMDQRIHDACLAFDDFRDVVSSGAVSFAGDVRQLAAHLDVPAASLEGTLEEAAALVAGDRPDALGRTHWPATLQPPYAAVRVRGALFHTQGGLVVDGAARVLREDGSAIPGLYAAGGSAIGISGHGPGGYLAGNGLLPALGLAYLAAGDVASGRS